MIRQDKRPYTEVAVGILIGQDGRFLLTSRPEGKPMAGYWEFPGGKLEKGESVEQALTRELQEELGITIKTAHLWQTTEFDYSHALVHLHWCKVYKWTGTLQMKEQQKYVWQHLPFTVTPILPGAFPVIEKLNSELFKT